MQLLTSSQVNSIVVPILQPTAVVTVMTTTTLGSACSANVHHSKQGLSNVCLIDGEVVAAFLSEDLKAPTVPDGDPFYATPEGAGMVKEAPATELVRQLEHKLFADHPEWADVGLGVLFHQ